MIDRELRVHSEGSRRPSVVARIIALLIAMAAISSAIVTILPMTGRSAPDTWTFMVYMNADSNLEDQGILDFLEMANVSNSPNLNIVVQFDRYGGPAWYYDDSSYGNWTDCKRYVVTNGMDPTPGNAIADIGEVDMSNWSNLVEFVNWSVDNYPADHYILDMWDHGGDWLGVSWDYTGAGIMRVSNMTSALQALKTYHPSLTFDIIAFDECSMGSIEIASELVGYADYLLASEIRVPDDGLNYTSLQAIVDDPSISTPSLGARFMTDYANYYHSLSGTPKDYMLNDSFSLSLFDLSKIDPLMTALDALASEMISNMGSWRESIFSARNATEDYPGRLTNDVVDIYHMCEQLGTAFSFSPAVQSLLSDVMDAFNASFVAEIHGTAPVNSTQPVDHVHGLSVYFPGNDAYFDSYYLTIGDRFEASTHWDEFLNAGYFWLPYPTRYEPTGSIVAVDSVISVWISEPIDLMRPRMITLYPVGQPGSPVLGSVTYNAGEYRLDFTPSAPLAPGTSYSAQGFWFDSQGNRGNVSWQFTTSTEIPEFPLLIPPIVMLIAIVLASRVLRPIAH